MAALTERQIEDVFEKFAEELIEPGLVLTGRQELLPNKLRVDLVFVDRAKRKVVVELKRESVSREDVGQLLEYAGLVKGARVILVAPHIGASLKTSFEHYGIEYIEFSPTRIEELHGRLATRIGDKAPIESDPIISSLVREVVPEPLAARTLRDGNIAFKVTFNDQNWSRVCSPDTFRFNVEEKRVVWCSLQAQRRRDGEEEHDCQSGLFRARVMTETLCPCYDAAALSTLRFSPGWTHGEEEHPLVCNEAKVGKVALLTSRRPGDAEGDRFIFALLHIDHVQTDDERWPETEFYVGNRATSVVLDKPGYIKFWNYYENRHSRDRALWGSGLFRYVTDTSVRGVLEEVISSAHTTADQKARASGLLARY